MAFEDSLWHHTSGDSFAPRPPLPGDVEADVAIVGGGYTGLWTAYYLHELDPKLRVVIVERQIAGFGASGRNGGWCSALFPASLSKLAGYADREAALAQHRAMPDDAGGNRAEHHPPLRPEAPNPAICRSTITTRSFGSSSLR